MNTLDLTLNYFRTTFLSAKLLSSKSRFLWRFWKIIWHFAIHRFWPFLETEYLRNILIPIHCSIPSLSYSCPALGYLTGILYRNLSFFFVTIFTNSWGSFINKVIAKKLHRAWTQQNTTWFYFLTLLAQCSTSAPAPTQLFCSCIAPSATPCIRLPSDSDLNPNHVFSVTQHFRGQYSCHLHASERAYKVQQLGGTIQRLKRTKEQQKQSPTDGGNSDWKRRAYLTPSPQWQCFYSGPPWTEIDGYVIEASVSGLSFLVFQWNFKWWLPHTAENAPWPKEPAI